MRYVSLTPYDIHNAQKKAKITKQLRNSSYLLSAFLHEENNKSHTIDAESSQKKVTIFLMTLKGLEVIRGHH